MDLDRFMTGSGILCVIAYLCISLVPGPIVGFAGCALCGLSVGVMWPGVFSKAAASVSRGGTAMFALLALAGDFGCPGQSSQNGYSGRGVVSDTFIDWYISVSDMESKGL